MGRIVVKEHSHPACIYMLGFDIHSDYFAQCCARNNCPTSARIGPARLLEASPCLPDGGAAAGATGCPPSGALSEVHLLALAEAVAHVCHCNDKQTSWSPAPHLPVSPSNSSSSTGTKRVPGVYYWGIRRVAMGVREGSSGRCYACSCSHRFIQANRNIIAEVVSKHLKKAQSHS